MKSLTKILLVSTIVFAFINTAAKASDNAVQDRHLSGFNAISVTGSFDVYISQTGTESVRVEAPGDVIDKVLTDVTNGTLNVHDRGNFNWTWSWNSRKMAVYVTVKDINSIIITGSGDVYFKDGLSTNSLKIHISGSGDVNGKLNVKTLDTSISGSGDVKLSGRADNSNASVSGSGDFSARGLITINTAIRVGGSGDASVNASNRVDAVVSGSGDIRYTGGAKHISTSKTGSGDIEGH